MTSVWDKVERHLGFVHAPSQYIGGEWNAIAKDLSKVEVTVCLAFPDAYTIGMSHLGFHIFYGMLNERTDCAAERAFAPWPDFEERIRGDGIPLFSVDSHTPVREFDIVGVSLQTELGFTNVLNMLDLAGIPLLANERAERDPLVIGGGPCASTPEPIADFFDAFIHGDGEEGLMRIVDLVKEMRRAGASREEILREFAKKVPGCYVPRFYRWEYEDDGTIRAFHHDPDVPPIIEKAIVADFTNSYYPLKPLVPHSEVVHDRINLEIMRGCPHRCHFCQAVNLKNRLRWRPVEVLVDQAEKVYKSTGYDDIALSSLSSGDYPAIQELMTRLYARFKSRCVTVSLPSLRVDEKLAELPRLMKLVRRGGFTVAPEGGTEALRKIIRKPIRDEDLFATARAAFEEGWNHIKLYFMIGLPGETDDDIRGIMDTARRVSAIGKEATGRWADVNVTISPFVPKPHTPFQFVGQRPIEYCEEVERRLVSMARRTRVHFKLHSPRTSYVEAVFARGDRRLSKALLAAHRNGRKFDEWREHFNFDAWMKVFEEAGVNADFYARRDIPGSELLPWDHIGSRHSHEHLWKEWEACRRAAAERTPSSGPSAVLTEPSGEPASLQFIGGHPWGEEIM